MPEFEDDGLRNAFQLLANETHSKSSTRFWNAPDWTATFTELKDAVGMRDSGGFQYHLNALDGTFIRKTDDGYTHLAGGIALYRAMLGSTMGPDAIDPIPLDEPCPNCGSNRQRRYEQQVFHAYCPACDESIANGPCLPAGLDDRSDDDRVRRSTAGRNGLSPCSVTASVRGVRVPSLTSSEWRATISISILHTPVIDVGDSFERR